MNNELAALLKQKLEEGIPVTGATGGGGGGGDASAANQTTEIARLTSIRDNQTNGTQHTIVDGTVTVSGSVTADTGLTQPLTDTELRATPVPISATTLTTIAGAVKNEDAAAGSGDPGIPMLAMRYAADTPTTDADGDYTFLKLDEEGRLKVATKPASYADITGDITAIQATISTPVAGGTVSGDVSRASNVMAFCTGTFSTVNCTFEGSLEASGDTNWFGIQAIRSNANTIETTTGNLSAQPAYGWEMSVNALKRVRVRATARTSGTQSWRFVQGTYATEPIPGAQVSGTQPVSGSVTVSGTATVTPANGTTYNVVTTASNNLAFIKASAGNLYEITVSNPTATACYVKLYNKASAPVVASDVPVMTIAIPATAAGVGEKSFSFGTIGKRFATGIAIAVVGAAAATDATNAPAGVQINATYI